MSKADDHGIVVEDEVREAVAGGGPVVALESTIISHGLPFPRNLEVARELEEMVRRGGAVPATIGVIDGAPVVGLSDHRLETLADHETRGPIAKASTRDLPIVAYLQQHAATTVAATSFLAHLAGIGCFATGGIGGVHRGAGETYDESADLLALATTPIVVVSAGVKSILDVGATLERLETLGVTVVGYRSRDFPGFYVSDSGFDLDVAVTGPEQVAGIAAARDRLGMPQAVLVAVPVPKEHELDRDLHDQLVAEALLAAEREGIQGKAVTPFLLDYLYRASDGASLEANVWAVRNNVAVATAVAVAMAEW